MRDADFGSVRLRAFGTYTLKARDPRTLLSELVGTDSSFEADEVSELLRSIINTTFAELMANTDEGILDLASSYLSLSHQLRERVAEQIDDEYGLDIPQLYIVNVSLPAEVEQALDARTSMNAVGDLGAYQAYQLGASMPVAAANPAGGVAGAGVGLGMGMAVAGQMLPGSSPAPQAPQFQQPPPPPAARFHVAQNGQATGPFDTAQVAAAVVAGQVRPDTLVWMPGMAQWAPAAQVPQLAPYFQAPQPPPPPTDG